MELHSLPKTVMVQIVFAHFLIIQSKTSIALRRQTKPGPASAVLVHYFHPFDANNLGLLRRFLSRLRGATEETIGHDTSHQPSNHAQHEYQSILFPVHPQSSLSVIVR